MSDVPFNQRLKDAIASGSSAAVGALIREAETITERALRDADAAKTRALDPLLDDDEIEHARKAAADAEFTQARMGEAVRLLSGKRDEFRRNEDQVERIEAYEKAMAKRDAVVARLRDEFPSLANRLGQLLADVASADALVDVVNRNLPAGRHRIESVEAVGRPGHSPNDAPPLVRMTIPPFDGRSPWPTWGSSGIGGRSAVEFHPNEIGSAWGDAPGDSAEKRQPASREGSGGSLSLAGPDTPSFGEAA